MSKKTTEFLKQQQTLIILVLTILLTLIKEFIPQSAARDVATYVSLGFLALLIIVAIIAFVKVKRQENNGMSNNVVILKTKQHCNVLQKYAKIVRKELQKNEQISQLKKNKEEEKDIIKRLTNKKISKDETEELEKKLNKLIETRDHKETRNFLKTLEEEKTFLVSQLICKKFSEMGRMLLNAEQFSLRIKFGEFLRDFSLEEEHRVSAYIDFIGWTNMLLGNTSKGERAIKSGIELARGIAENTEDEIKKNKYYFYITRGYRHLGSTRRTLEKNPAQSVEYLNLGEENLAKINKSVENFEHNKFQEMDIGIKYGILNAQYNEFIINKKRYLNTEECYVKFYQSYLTFEDFITESSTFNNKHRYIKFILLEIKYLKEIKTECDIFRKYAPNSNLNPIMISTKIKDSLEIVGKIFKDNIFMDESIEYYFDEQVDYFKHQLVELLKQGDKK